MNEGCLICERIEMINQGINPWFVKELETGYVVMGDSQTYRGYTLFLCKKHNSELHELDTSFKNKFLSEMSIVAEAVYRAFRPDKMNYELLGNTDKHMHWHLFPRRSSDKKAYTAIWAISKEERNDKPTGEELELMKKLLLTELNKLL
jgi:diadenosine tetraphosphate (Ap4A) HIT family hydrolase